MSSDAPTHIGFSDESNYNHGRFRSLALVTIEAVSLEEIESALMSLLKESNVSEFKWKNLNSARARFAAQKMADLCVKLAYCKRLRLDVLVWDTQDRRHNVIGRDDIQNLQRMYYHLFRNVLRLRWPSIARWCLYPDENTALDWNQLHDYLENASLKVGIEPHTLFTKGGFRLQLEREFGLEKVQAVNSREHPLLQAADLFAGLAVFSRDKFDDYEVWLAQNCNQATLFAAETAEEVRCSSSARERFEVLRHFDNLCKEHKLGVSLMSNKGLRTRDPTKPLNFWLYEPQHSEDRAPTRTL